MSEETDGIDAGAEATTVAPEVETPSEATAEQPTGAETPDEPDAGAEAKPKQTPWFQKRIDEVTRDKYEAQRQADYWRGVAEGRSPAQDVPKVASNDDQPREDQFEDYDAYQRALTKWEVRQELKAEGERTQAASRRDALINKAQAKYADFDQVVNNPSLPITQAMADVILDSEVGPDIAYHLGSNPDEAARIAKLPAHRQAAELGKIEDRLSAPKPAPKDPPPAPPKTINGITAGVVKDPSKMTMAEYVAARNAGQI